MKKTETAAQLDLDRNTIREIFLAHGFTIKPDRADLKPYVFKAAEALLAQARAQPAAAPIAPSVNSGEGASSIEEDLLFQCLLYNYVAARMKLKAGTISEDEATDAFRGLLAHIDAQLAQQRQAAPHAPTLTVEMVRAGMKYFHDKRDPATKARDVFVDMLAAAPAAPHAQAEPVAAQFKMPREAWEECSIDEEEKMRTLGYKFRYLYAAPAPQEAEQASASPAGENDTARLDWLDEVNRKTNARYKTTYGWKFDINHNRAALTDHHYPALSVRAAIDAAMSAAPTTTKG